MPGLTPIDRVLVLFIAGFFVPLPLIELWFAIGWEPGWARALIDGYAELGDPLVAARTSWGRFVFVVHTFVYQPVHVLLLVGILRRRWWTGLLAVSYAASGLTTDAFWSWFQLTGPYPPTRPLVVFGLLAPYTICKLLLLGRFLPGLIARSARVLPDRIEVV